MASQAQFLVDILDSSPAAYSQIFGSPAHPQLVGLVYLYETGSGVFLIAQVQGLPHGGAACAPDIFGFHIHSGSACSGSAEDPFAGTDGHYNPKNCPHPAHAGDLPPLFGNNGYALSAFFTDRFTVEEVVGRTFVVHARPDDFTAQPAGNSGEKIACGRILRAPV